MKLWYVTELGIYFEGNLTGCVILTDHMCGLRQWEKSWVLIWFIGDPCVVEKENSTCNEYKIANKNKIWRQIFILNVLWFVSKVVPFDLDCIPEYFNCKYHNKIKTYNVN